MPAAAIAAAAWSWVEKMLQEPQRTSAPRAVSVSIRTAVWMVMCSEPVMRAPLSGCCGAVLLAHGHQAGHLVLGERDLLAAEVGERQVGDLEVLLVVVLGDGHAAAFSVCVEVGGSSGEQALVLVLLPAEPVAGGDPLGRCGRSSNQRSRAARSSGSALSRRAKATSDRRSRTGRAARAACAGAAARRVRRCGSRTACGGSSIRPALSM